MWQKFRKPIFFTKICWNSLEIIRVTLKQCFLLQGVFFRVSWTKLVVKHKKSIFSPIFEIRSKIIEKSLNLAENIYFYIWITVLSDLLAFHTCLNRFSLFRSNKVRDDFFFCIIRCENIELSKMTTFRIFVLELVICTETENCF